MTAVAGRRAVKSKQLPLVFVLNRVQSYEEWVTLKAAAKKVLIPQEKLVVYQNALVVGS